MTKDITQHLSIKDKVKLFKELYTELSGYGCDGDTELAHINPYEAQLLKSIGGSGTVNQITGLREYKGGGSPPPPPPATQSVTQQTEFPDELKPFIKDVLGKAQAIQQKRESEGYIPFEGPQVASFTPEQEQAFAGISGLVGQGEQYFDPATRLAAASAIAPRQAEVEQFMSPYMQNVVEIQQREAQRQADVAAQQLGAQAVGAGGFGGSRQAILEAEQQRNLQQQLGDIQARGLAAAYEDAQRRISEQRGRELAASGQFMQLGQVAPQQQQRELTALEAVGAQRQAQSQRGLDIARQQFQEEQTFPERTLQQYQSVIRGFPLAPTTYQTSQQTIPAPSFLQQAAGLGTTAIGLAGAFGGFGRNAKAGGKVDPNSGLGSIVVKKRIGGNFQQAMAESALQPEYNKEMFERLLNREITPLEYTKLIQKYEDSAMAEMPEETDIDPKFLASRTIPKNRGTAMSPLQARIAAQERRMGLSMADQPVTPLRSKAVSPAIREAAREANELAELRRQIQSGMGGADVPVIPKEERRVRMPNRLRQTVQGIKGTPAEELGLKPGSFSPLKIPIVRDFKKGVEDLAETTENLPEIMTKFGVKTFGPIYDGAGNLITYTTGIKTPTAEDVTGVSPFKLSDLTEIFSTEGDKSAELRKQIQAGMGGADQPTTAPAAPTAAPQETAVAEATETTTLPSDVLTIGKLDPLGEADQLVVDKPTKEVSPLVAKANAISSSVLPDVIKGQREEYFNAIKQFNTKRGEMLQKQKTGLDRDRWLAVADMGLNIMAQPGGQTLLEAIGKGAKGSGLIKRLGEISKEEGKLDLNIAQLDVETIKAKYQLKKEEAAYVKDAANFQLKMAELEALKAKATNTADRNRIDDMIKALNLRLKIAKFDQDRKGLKSKLSESDVEIAKDYFKENIDRLGEDPRSWVGMLTESDPREKLESEFLDAVRRNRSKPISEIFDALGRKYTKK